MGPKLIFGKILNFSFLIENPEKKMSKLRKFAFGTGFGVLFITLLPDDHYRIFRRNFYRPISKEINKTEIDIAKVLRYSIEGIEDTFKEYWGRIQS